MSTRAQREMEAALWSAEKHLTFVVGFVLAGNYKVLNGHSTNLLSVISSQICRLGLLTITWVGCNKQKIVVFLSLTLAVT